MPFIPRCALLLWLLAAPVSWAADAADPRALAKAQFLLRQVNNEKSQLQQELEQVRQQRDGLQKQLAATKTLSEQREQMLTRKFGEANAQWLANKEKDAQELRDLKEKLRLQAELNEQITGRLQQQTDNFSRCYHNNQKLYGINQDLLEKYQKKSILDVIRQNEPFTGEARVDVENLIQDNQYQLDDLVVGGSDGTSEKQQSGP